MDMSKDDQLAVRDAGREALRRQLQLARRQLDVSVQIDASKSVVDVIPEIIRELTKNHEPGVVAGYVAIDGEIDPEPALDHLRTNGWRVVLPVCGANVSMEFCPFEPGDPTKKNHLGIHEPVSAPVEIQMIDVVVVPGVGFGRDGSRIGHGAGYYDRFFARCFAAQHDPIRLGLAHDVQIVDLPAPESWDVAMHTVISPSEVFRIRNS